MALVPISYNLRSLLVRRSSTVLTMVSVGATVAVVAAVLSLQQGFATLFAEAGRSDLAVFLRPGATDEGVSAFSRESARILINEQPEIAEDGDGRPLASGELYLAMRLRKMDGGETNVPIRGVQQETFAIRDPDLRLVAGRLFSPGHDEVIVGRSLTDRIQDCQLQDVLRLNTTPFVVVGIFEHDGPFQSEIWGDVERMQEALDRPGYSRVLARLRPGVDVAALAARLENDPRTPAKVLTERQYLASQTLAMSYVLISLGVILGVIMGIGAVFTGANTMLAALAARTHEVGILLSVGFRPFSIFLSFLFEALVLGLLGGLVGCLLVVPLNGVRTGATNWQTFTEVAFAFRVTPAVLVVACAFAAVLGMLGGAVPAWRAARLRPTQALRRE